MTDLYEAKAALLAVKEQTDLPVFVTMSFDEGRRTFTGCTIPSMARTLEGLGADAIGLNCSLGPDQLLPLLRRNTRHPPARHRQAQCGASRPGGRTLPHGPRGVCGGAAARPGGRRDHFGGCCGTSPEYIRRLRAALADKHPVPRRYAGKAFVCTPTRPLRLDGVRVIGERINPTGKKRFQQALLEEDLDYILDVAVQQEDAGADILDVNVGYPGVDEVDMLPRVVRNCRAPWPCRFSWILPIRTRWRPAFGSTTARRRSTR